MSDDTVTSEHLADVRAMVRERAKAASEDWRAGYVIADVAGVEALLVSLEDKIGLLTMPDQDLTPAQSEQAAVNALALAYHLDGHCMQRVVYLALKKWERDYEPIERAARSRTGSIDGDT